MDSHVRVSRPTRFIGSRKNRLGCSAASAGNHQPSAAHSRRLRRASAGFKDCRTSGAVATLFALGLAGRKDQRRLVMRRSVHKLALVLAAIAITPTMLRSADKQKTPHAEFHTSDRCLACHNGLTTPDGKDVSIGFDWRSSIMANSARDPYWQASVRREDIDHPESKAEIEDGCADCHMPMARYEAKQKGKLGEVFAHLPFDQDPEKNASAEDGVTCSICHQISNQNFGKRESFNGGFLIKTPKSKNDHPEFGPFAIANGQATIMQTSTGGFRPTAAEHILDSAMCATCHTLYTKSLAPGGKVLGTFPEQVPYQEWLHSDYPNRNTCQSCHMPEVQGQAPISAVMGQLRPGVRQHTFLGGNFFVLRLLDAYRDDLSVTAMSLELTAEAT